MTPDTERSLNVGWLVRNGLRLTTAEAVAVVHAACTQVSERAATAIPASVDGVWITHEGILRIAEPVVADRPRAAVAALLESLLPKPTDETESTVPGPLRTLPARLRESGDAASNDLSDLSLILTRYLPADPRNVLQQLVRRGTGNATVAERDESTTAAAAENVGNDLPIYVAEHPRPAPVPPRRTSRYARLAAVSVLLLAVAGFIGYGLTSSSLESVTRATQEVTGDRIAAPEAPAAKSRIITSKRDEKGESANGTAVETRQPTPLLLPVSNGAFSPSFAADGALLFHAGRNSSGQLFTTNVNNRTKAAAIAPLISDGARNYHPRLSPDGSTLAFDSDRDGERGVYIAELNGNRFQGGRRVSGDGYAAVPSWSPDGTRLAFIKAEPDHPRVWNLWLLKVATGELQRHTTFRSGQIWGASWFPDGHRLAYSHEDRLVVLNLQGGAHDVHSSPVKGRLVRTPAVSPDGGTIVFQVYRDGVWMLDLATGQARRVLNDDTAEEFAWDANGRRMAYHSRRDGQWRIWLMGWPSTSWSP